MMSVIALLLMYCCNIVVAFSPIHTTPIYKIHHFKQQSWSSNRLSNNNNNNDNYDSEVEEEGENRLLVRGGGKDELVSWIEWKNELEWRNQFHDTLVHLRTQLPKLLYEPISSSAIDTFYTENVTLLVVGETLSTGRDELQSLSSTIVTATTAARRANQFVSSTFATNLTTGGGNPEIDCELIYSYHPKKNTPSSKKLLQVYIKWGTNLPSSSPNNSNKLEGISKLTLDGTSKFQIKQHEITKITLNQLDASSIVGDTLSTLRRTITNNKQISSFLFPTNVMKNSLDFLSSTLKNTNMNQTSSTSQPAPLYYYKINQNQTFNDIMDDTIWTKSKRISVDDDHHYHKLEYQNMNQTIRSNDVNKVDSYEIPYPGGKVWREYMVPYQLYDTFYQTSIPLLGYGTITTKKSTVSLAIQELFSSNAKLIGKNNTVYLDSGSKVADFYTNLLLLRKSTNSDWTIQRVVIKNWYKQQVDVYWTSTIMGGTTIQGIDRFTLSSSSSPTKITCVEQRKFQIGPYLQQADYDVIPIFIRAVIENKPLGADLLSGLLLDRVIPKISPQQSTSTTTSTTSSSIMTYGDDNDNEIIISRLSPSAAVQFYDILCSVHSDVPTLFMKRKEQKIPLEQYFSSQITLRGLLGEVVANDLIRYKQLVQPALSSLNAAIDRQWVKLDSKPSCQYVQFTKQGTIQVNIFLPFRIDTTSLLSPSSLFLENILPQQLQQRIVGSGNKLHVEIITEYFVDSENGKIIEQRLLESRINGQLTPGDLVSRWLRNDGTSNANKNSNSGGTGATAIRVLLDALQFARSVNNNNNNN